MTICIAANCADGIVVTSDRMISAPFLALEFDHPTSKIEAISNTCVVLTAGDALATDDILIGGMSMADQLQNPLIRDLADHLRIQFVSARRRLIDQRILEPHGFSFVSFYQEGGINRLPPDLAVMLANDIQQFRLGVSMIVSGVDRSGPHIFAIEDPGVCTCYDRLGYQAIGSGAPHALRTLVENIQHRQIPIEQTLFNVYTAKRAAEVAPGVGTTTDIWVIDSTGVHEQREEVKDQLGKLHDLRNSQNEQVTHEIVQGLRQSHE